MASIFDRLAGPKEPKKTTARRRVSRKRMVKTKPRERVAQPVKKIVPRVDRHRDGLLRREADIDRKLGVLEERERQLERREKELLAVCSL